MPLDATATAGPYASYLQGTVAGAALNTEFPPGNFAQGTLLLVRDLPGRPVFVRVEETVGVPLWRRLGPGQSALTFGSSSVVVGTRTLDPGGPSRASVAGAPAAANPAILMPFAGRAWVIGCRRTNTPAATCALTLFVNNVASTLTATIAAAAATANATLAAPVVWSAFDTLAMRGVSAGGTSNNVTVTILIEAQP